MQTFVMAYINPVEMPGENSTILISSHGSTVVKM
jgi:hypothetical protein